MKNGNGQTTKMQIVVEGFKSGASVAELCTRYEISQGNITNGRTFF